MSEIQFKTRKIVAGLMMFASVIFLTSCALDSSTTSSDTTISTESNSTEDDSSSSVSTEEERVVLSFNIMIKGSVQRKSEQIVF